MEEREPYSVLDFVRAQKSSDLCRFTFCARINSPDALLKFFARCKNENSSSGVTGLLLVYQRYLVHLLESPEEEIFQICSCFVDAEPRCFEASKCFPMQANVEERFFDKWQARRVASDCENLENCGLEFVDNLDNMKEIYCKLIDDLYVFCDELRTLRTISRACFMDKLETLASDKDSHLPDVRTLESILQSSWGESLVDFIRDYNRGISSADVGDVIWPFPTSPCPAIDTIK